MSGRLKKFNRTSTKRRRRQLLRRDPHCHYCRAKLTFTSSTIDHVIPLSKLGGNGKSNTVLCCRECNVRKGNSVGPPRPREDGHQWSDDSL